MSYSMWLFLLLDICVAISFTAAAIRLVNGNDECSGRVEVQLNEHWGTVCANHWDLDNAAVVCKEAKCGTALQAMGGSYFGQGSGSVLMSYVHCKGTESTLDACEYSTSNCGHIDDAGVICETLRLVNGSSSCSGRVEILHDGTWGTVCDDGWDITDAAVTCRTLGCGAPIKVTYNGFFGQGSGQIWMNNVQCNGSESSLSQCGSNGWGINPSMERSDAGVICQELKLVGGDNPCSGTVQIFHNEVWGTVCQSSWDETDAAVVCRELGCGSYAEAKTGAFFGQGVGPVWMNHVNCRGDESTLRACEFGGWGGYSCDHQNDAGVICKEFKKRGIIRIKVKISQGVNANDPSVRMMIMEKMKREVEEKKRYFLQWTLRFWKQF